MKIVDTSICCAPYESELIYIKLQLEHPHVDEFIFTENCFDYRGFNKGYFLADLFKQGRFDPFRNKITVLQANRNFGFGISDYNIDPPEFAQAEAFLREFATEYIISKYDDEDRVLLTDCDEMFDFIDEERTSRILKELNTDDPIQFDRVRYIFDFDNRAFRDYCDMVSPSFKVKHLKSGLARLSNKKWVGRQVGNDRNPMCFEYCHCFNYDGYIKKHMSSLHTCWTKEKLDEALQGNFWPATAYQRHPDNNNRWHWFMKVPLHKNNSPSYIRHNLEVLRTNLVNPDYINFRKEHYGFDGLFEESKDFNDTL